MSTVLERPVKLETDRRFYAEILTRARAEALFASADGTRLEEPMLNLVHALKCASNCHAIPEVLASSAPTALAAYSKRHPPRNVQVFKQLMRAMGEDLARTHDLPLNVHQRRAVASWARRKHDELDAIMSVGAAPSADDAWADYLEVTAFKSMLVGMTAHTYTSCYFAYECYLASVVEVITGKWPGRTSEVGSEIRRLFPVICAELWDAPIITAARHVRDGYVHRGGRIRASVEAAVSPYVQIEKGFALVTAREVNVLMPTLVDLVIQITASAKKEHPGAISVNAAIAPTPATSPSPRSSRSP